MLCNVHFKACCVKASPLFVTLKGGLSLFIATFLPFVDSVLSLRIHDAGSLLLWAFLYTHRSHAELLNYTG